jgi:hypothetical protein
VKLASVSGRPIHDLRTDTCQPSQGTGTSAKGAMRHPLAGTGRGCTAIVRTPLAGKTLRASALLGVFVASLNLACTGSVGTAGSTMAGGSTGLGGQGPLSGTGGTVTGTGTGGSGGPVGSLDVVGIPIRRLNRAEYCNTVRDLLGTSQRPCDQFPQDSSLFGFDTVASVQSLSPLQVDLYEQAATSLIDEVVALPATDARRSSIFVCDPAAAADPKPCALQILTGFAARAFRRPVPAAELANHVALLDIVRAQGGTVADGVVLGLRAILLSPHFLFRVEIDPNPVSTDLHPVSDYELASRLSYALWSSMPDAALFAAAAAGTLHDPAQIGNQVTRMLQDPKAHALTTDLVGQWLALRQLPAHEVNALAYPTFDEALRTAMEGESNLFFDEFFRTKVPAINVLTANFTYINARLAAHYGMPAPTGSAFVRVSLAGSTRSGMLMQGSILTVTSHPTRTSPVARGVWILGNLLCSQPPPPPANVPVLVEPAPGTPAPMTMRETLAAHRQLPQCASCHNTIDPIGLGFENFDGIGLYRTTDAGKPIDAAGVLPDGTAFSGPGELATILSKPERGFEACMARQLLTYTVGRGFDDAGGKAWSAQIVALAHKSDGSFGAMLNGILQSDLFTKRRGEGP